MSRPSADAEFTQSNRLVKLAIDVLAVALVVALGSLSFTYPFGHDQSLYAYVGREWLHRGAIPYRDVFDHKTPGIYAVHAIVVAVFGDNTWGIRVADLLAVLTLAWLGTLAACSAGRSRINAPLGLFGATTIVAYIFHYGFFDYWCSAQSEIWYTTFSLAGVVLSLRIQVEARYVILAGAACGIALIIKPPAMSFVALTAFILAWRAWGTRERRWARVAKSWALFAGGAAIPCVFTFGYLGAHHALPAFLDIVVGANSYYVAHEKEVHSIGDVVEKNFLVLKTCAPVSILVLGAIALGLGRAAYARDGELAERYLLCLGLLVAALLSVGIQQKYYWLHWMPIIACGVVVASTLFVDLSLFLQRKGKRWLIIPSFLFVWLLAFALTDGENWTGRSMWMRETGHSIAWLRGDISAEQHASHFRVDFMYFFYDDSRRVALWLDDHSSPDDIVLVRGFHPEIYILANRHYDARFFWSLFLVDPGRAYRRADYLAEDAQAIHDRPPRFAVAMVDAPSSIVDSSSFFKDRGYVSRARFGAYEVLERGATTDLSAP